MLTTEDIETASVYANCSRPALRLLGLFGRIRNREHAIACTVEIENILTETTVIDGQAVKTDWMQQVEELTALICLNARCANFVG